MYYIIFISISFIFVLISNICMRFLKKSSFAKGKYINNKFLLSLLIVPTKRKILLSSFINYIIQVLLFLFLIILFSIDLILNNTNFLNSIWVYVVYIVISLFSFGFSGICNKWNY